MNIKLKAAVQTAGIIGATGLIAVAVQCILKYTPVELLQPAIAIVAIIGLIYLMYTIVLGQVESQEKLKEMEKNRLNY
jgi:hypothetical protein